MSPDRFAELLALGKEQPGVEFKGSGSSTNKQLMARVVRAVLAMANRRDGGYVIIGVHEEGETLTPTGLSPEDLLSWKEGTIQDRVATYADPYVELQLEVQKHVNMNFVLITVHEFGETPVICKKEYSGVLRDGALYVRTKRKPESVEVPSHAELRDLLETAAMKRVRTFLANAQSAGLTAGVDPAASDEAQFEKQLGGF